MQLFSSKPVLRLIARFRADRAGNVAMIFAICALPLLATAGFAVDLHRHSVARAASQEAADAAALAAAGSGKKTQAELASVAEAFLRGNMDIRFLDDDYVTTVEYIDDLRVKVSIDGGVPTIFAGLIGISKMDLGVSATAVRGTAEKVEVALVLDNTWSMSEADASGKSKINALKTSAKLLVTELMTRDESTVRIGIVPYAEYVNVGMANRNQPWLSVGADYYVSNGPRRCDKSTTRTTCTGAVTTPRTCERTVDGVKESYSCPTTDRSKEVCTTRTVPEYETNCSGGGGTNYKWYGCVGSRKQGTLRLNDSAPATTYPGWLTTSQTCLNPILPLSDIRAPIIAAIDGLVVNVGSHRPLTHIPSGMVWGVNVLSMTAPFTDGGDWHPANRDPRKILVLMTDGANTLRFNSGDGRHPAFSGNATNQGNQLSQTNADVTAICNYAKSKKIEIFTVALAVSSGSAQTMLQGCATDSDHYFDARDNAALEDAFSDIAASINAVRLVQ